MITKVDVLIENIVKVYGVEAIVNTTSPTQKERNGVNGAIHKAAGNQLMNECSQNNSTGVGEVFATKAYDLPYKMIFHTIPPVWKDGNGGEKILLESCYRNILQLAKDSGIRSIAFPAIAAGYNGFPHNVAAKIAVDTVAKFCDEYPEAFDHIVWVVLVEPTRELYQIEIEQYFPKHHIIYGPGEVSLVLESQLLSGNSPMLLQLPECIDDEAFNDIIFEKIEAEVSKAEGIEYVLAAGSGLLSGILSFVICNQIDLEKAHEWGTDEFGKIIIKLANILGNKTDDLKEAIKYFEDNFHIPGDAAKDAMGGGRQHHFRDFTHHPSIVGLVCSILAQFSGKVIGTTTDGKIQFVKVEKDIGKNIIEKLFFGIVKWVFHLVSDMDGSKDNPGKGTGIPGPILSFLKEISVLPFFRSMQIDYQDNEITFSQWLSKLFNGTFFRNEEGKVIPFDLRTEIGLGVQLVKQAYPVIINECIVRAIFFIRRFILEIKDKNISSVKELGLLEPEKFLPYNNRALCRMITVASGIFVVTNTTGSIAKSLIRGDKTGKTLFLNLNYVGIGRFVIACHSDANYIADDLRKIYYKYQNHHSQRKENERLHLLNQFQFLTLNEQQLRLLLSIEKRWVEYDIRNTKDKKEIERKQLWLSCWQSSVLKSLKTEADDFFIADDFLYSYLCYEEGTHDSHDWLALFGMELAGFRAYSPLEIEEDQQFKGLKFYSDYLKNVFYVQQSFITEKDIKEFTKLISHYSFELSGKKEAVMIGAAGTIGLSMVTGGLAFAFAPQIATFLLGDAFVGLSGAALTNATLAFLGGGALAAGGFGVAGGTVFLAGGGAMLGLLSSGTASLISAFSILPEEYYLNECAKLLAISHFILQKNIEWACHLNIILDNVTEMKENLFHYLELAKLQTKDKERKYIKKLETIIIYLTKTVKEMEKIQKLSQKNNR